MNASPQILTIALSSRALFDLEKGHNIYVNEGIDAYQSHQIESENEVLLEGAAFSLVKKLLALNHKNHRQIEVVLVSKNSADTGLRIFNSIEHYGLNIERAVFTGGKPTFGYTRAFQADLFLSADPQDVREALSHGVAAATVLPSSNSNLDQTQTVKVAFDGDAVLFSDEAERVYQNEGLEAFLSHEKDAADRPLPGGPFKQFLAMLNNIQNSQHSGDKSPIRTALITARGAPAHERVIKTLRCWDISIDETFFLGGKDKGLFLKEFKADIFFDDHKGHCESARSHVPSGHVPSGVRN